MCSETVHCGGFVPGSMDEVAMQVVYSDESGIGSEIKEPLTVVTAFIINMDKDWVAVEQKLFPIIKRNYRQFGHKELKGAALLRQLRRNGGKVKDADRILKEVLSVPYEHFLPIFYGAVHRTKFNAMIAGRPINAKIDTPLRWALRDCLEQVESYVHARFKDDKIMWIADQASYNETSYRREHASAQRWVKWGVRKFSLEREKPRLSHLVDTMYFGPSHESAALQLADVCGSVVSQYLRSKFIKPEPFVEPYYELIRCRIPNDGKAPRFCD